MDERFAIYVWRSVRADGDTKTEKSGARWSFPARPPTRYASTGHARRRRGWRRVRCGAITA
jgi:hypothetical protein